MKASSKDGGTSRGGEEEQGKAVSSVQYLTWTIDWGSAGEQNVRELRVTGNGEQQVLGQEDRTYRAGDYFDVLSVVGPWLSFDTIEWEVYPSFHPAPGEDDFGTEGTEEHSWETIDVTRGNAVGLEEVFGEQAVFDALMGVDFIRTSVGAAQPKSLEELRPLLGRPDAPFQTSAWAFDDVTGSTVKVSRRADNGR